jgi:hypothetical protein
VALLARGMEQKNKLRSPQGPFVPSVPVSAYVLVIPFFAHFILHWDDNSVLATGMDTPYSGSHITTYTSSSVFSVRLAFYN